MNTSITELVIGNSDASCAFYKGWAVGSVIKPYYVKIYPESNFKTFGVTLRYMDCFSCIVYMVPPPLLFEILISDFLRPSIKQLGKKISDYIFRGWK